MLATLATASLDKTLKFWDVKSGRELKSYPVKDAFMGLAFSHDGLTAYASGSDPGSGWLKGPHQARLVSGVYSENALGIFETSLQFPAYFDGLLFAKHVTPATPLKR